MFSPAALSASALKTWRASWANSGTTTTGIVSTARSMARLLRDAPALLHLLLPCLTVTLGGSIAELCSRSRLPLDWEFATDRLRCVEWCPQYHPVSCLMIERAPVRRSEAS